MAELRGCTRRDEAGFIGRGGGTPRTRATATPTGFSIATMALILGKDKPQVCDLQLVRRQGLEPEPAAEESDNPDRCHAC